MVPLAFTVGTLNATLNITKRMITKVMRARASLRHSHSLLNPKAVRIPRKDSTKKLIFPPILAYTHAYFSKETSLSILVDNLLFLRHQYPLFVLHILSHERCDSLMSKLYSRCFEFLLFLPHLFPACMQTGV